MFSRGHAIKILICGVVLMFCIVLPTQAQTDQVPPPVQLGRGYISGVAWSPLGQLFGVATTQGIWLYSIEMKLISHLNSPPALDLTWNRDGTKLLTSHKGHLLVWDIPVHKVIMDVSSSHDPNMPIMDWNPEGDGFAVSWGGGLPQLWHVGADHPFRDMHSGSMETPLSINRLVWTPQGLLGFSSEGTLFEWDPVTGEESSRQSIIQTQFGTFSVDYAYDQVAVVDGFNPRSFSVYDRQTGKIQVAELGVENRISAAAWQPGSSTLILVTDLLQLQLWETNPIPSLSKRIETPLYSTDKLTRSLNVVLAWHPDGKRLLVAGGGMLFLWDMPAGEIVGQIREHAGRINAFAWSPDSTMLITAHGTDYGANSDDHVRVWDIADNQAIHACINHSGAVNTVAWNPRRPLIASGAGSANRSDSNVMVWDPFTCEQKRRLSHIEGDSGILWISDVAWNTDGTLLLSSGGGVASVWDIQQQTRLRMFDVGSPIRLAWTSERHLLAGSLSGKDIFLLDTNTGKDLARLETGFSALKVVRWSADHKYLAAVGQGKTQNTDVIQVWDADQLRLLMMIEDKASPILDIAWHPNGKIIAAAHQGQVSIHDWGTGLLLQILDLDSAEITGIGWSPNGSEIAASTAEGIIWVWHWE